MNDRLDEEKCRKDAQHVHSPVLDAGAILSCVEAPNTPAVCETACLYGTEIPIPSQVVSGCCVGTCRDSNNKMQEHEEGFLMHS